MSLSLFLVLQQQYEQFHPEGFFVFAELDKVSTEIQGLSSPNRNFQDLQGDFYFKIQLQAMTFKDFCEAYEPCISLGAIAIENVFCVCIA